MRNFEPRDETWFDPPDRQGQWVTQAIGWDGGLPVLLALTPEAFRLAGVDKGIIQCLCIGVMPPIAALIRAHFGMHQLARSGHAGPAYWRQILFGVALCVLMFFEISLGVILVVPGAASIKGWQIVGTAYLIYLSLVLTALRPPVRPS